MHSFPRKFKYQRNKTRQPGKYYRKNVKLSSSPRQFHGSSRLQGVAFLPGDDVMRYYI